MCPKSVVIIDSVSELKGNPFRSVSSAERTKQPVSGKKRPNPDLAQCSSDLKWISSSDKGGNQCSKVTKSPSTNLHASRNLGKSSYDGEDGEEHEEGSSDVAEKKRYKIKKQGSEKSIKPGSVYLKKLRTTPTRSRNRVHRKLAKHVENEDDAIREKGELSEGSEPERNPNGSITKANSPSNHPPSSAHNRTQSKPTTRSRSSSQN